MTRIAAEADYVAEAAAGQDGPMAIRRHGINSDAPIIIPIHHTERDSRQRIDALGMQV